MLISILPVYAFGNASAGIPEIEAWLLAEIYDEENYIKNDFNPNQVQVVMKYSYAESLNKSPEFPGIEIVYIESMNYFIPESRYNDTRAIYLITLARESKEGVLAAIQVLKNNPNVAYSQPNYIMPLAVTTIPKLAEWELAEIYNEENYKKDFNLNQVSVGMNYSASESLGRIQAFPGLEIVSVENMYESVIAALPVKFDYEILETLDKVRAVFIITLASESREGVLNAIQILKNNPDVAYAQPNYIGYLVDEPTEVVFTVTELMTLTSYIMNPVGTLDPALLAKADLNNDGYVGPSELETILNQIMEG